MNHAAMPPTTIAASLYAAKTRLEPESDSASLDAQALLAWTLGADRAYLLAHGDAALTDEQAARFAALVARRAAGEPVAYILGRRAFYDREFIVTPAVLIPRPETELLLERALAFVRGRAHTVAVDVGTGSGALAVTLAALCPGAQVHAVDISPAALEVARRNAALHAAPVTFHQGDLLGPLWAAGVQVDLLLANLPYIASDELPALAVSRFEPALALDGGADGLALVRRLLAQAPALLRPGALALLEIGAGQGAAALALARAALRPVDAGVLPDYAGLDRVVWARMG